LVQKNSLADLSGCGLTHEACSLSFSCAILSKTKAFDMCMSEGTIVAGVSLDFADLHHVAVDLGY
jgi:hypothetical protein